MNRVLEISLELAKNALKIKYRRNVIGIAWSFLNPLFTIAVISLMFSVLMGMAYSDFFLMFFPAYLAWMFFSNVINGSMSALTQNESLIKKVPIDCLVFPLSSFFISLFEFLVSIFLFVLIAIFFTKITFSFNLIYLFVGFVLLSFFSFGLSLILSIATTKWTDLTHIVSMVLQTLFYISPVLYTKEFISGKVAFVDLIFYLNPMAYFLDMFRYPLSYDKAVSINVLLIAIVFSLISLVVGFYYFNKEKINIAVRM